MAPTPPKVLLDEAHENYHTAEGRYRPFVELLSANGYVVRSNDAPFSATTLSAYDMLVVANAIGAGDDPAGPAFGEAEELAVQQWVDAGGALWLIADHYPFGKASASLAARFGVVMSGGMVGDDANAVPGADDAGFLVFSRENGLLGEHPIVAAGPGRARVERVFTFAGQSLIGPAGSAAILRLSDTATEMMPPDRHLESARGRAQAVALTYGKGRVFVAGEAAMFSEQQRDDGRPFGMNFPGCDNRQLTVNIAGWLSRRRP